MNLILKPTGSHYGTDWGENDYVVLCNREVVGRVMLHPQASKEEPWFWTITAQRQPHPKITGTQIRGKLQCLPSRRDCSTAGR